MGATGRLRYEVLGLESVTIEGSNYQAFHTKVSINATTGSVAFNVPGEAWFRESDLAVIKLTLTITFQAPGQTLITTTTVTNSPPADLRWPLTSGERWSVNSWLKVTIETTGQPPIMSFQMETVDLLVEPSENLTVPAGSFAVTPVRQDLPIAAYSIAYWSGTAGNTVEEKSYGNNTEIGSMELASYRYAAAASSPSGFTALLFGPMGLLVGVVAIAVAVVAVMLIRRSRRRPPMPSPMPAPLPSTPPTETPSLGPAQEPPGPPPGSP